jgi:sirohydrochlorin ferrochelatase
VRHPQLSGSPERAVLLVAHGSRNPAAEVVVRELAAQVRAGLPGREVAVAYLDFTSPTVGEALRELADAGVGAVVAVPLLFAPGYHVRVDLPAAIAEVRVGRPWLDVVIALPLGAAPAAGDPDLLLDALMAQLAPPVRYDAVVLGSAGSSDPLARAAIEDIAARWSDRIDRPVVSAYATACGPTVSEAIDQLQSRGYEHVAVSGLFIAPGRLPEAVRRSAVESGAVAVTGPFGADPRLVELVVLRQEEGSSVPEHGRSFSSSA